MRRVVRIQPPLSARLFEMVLAYAVARFMTVSAVVGAALGK
jgi:hypothetical protein